jgi:hypothetical protein
MHITIQETKGNLDYLYNQNTSCEVPKFTFLMQLPYCVTKIVCTLLFFNHFSFLQESRALAIKSGVLPHLLSRTANPDRHVGRLACSIISRFVTLQSGREALARDAGLSRILVALHDANHEVSIV